MPRSASASGRVSRAALVTALGAAGALLLGACGGAPAPADPAPADGAPAAAGAFPVTVTHALGEATIPAKPQRVVTLGLGDLAIASALDAPVVGSIPNFVPGVPVPPYLDGTADPAVANLDQVVPGAALNIEKILALEPDLILAVSSSQLDPDSYAQLSGVVPVVAYERSLYGSTMQEDALLIGRALGDEAGAQELIDSADQAVQDFAAARAGLAGRTYLYGQARGDVLPMVVGKENLSTVFMSGLGLTPPASFADVPTSGQLAPGTIGLSYEEAGRLDEADVLFMTFASPADQTTFEQNPVVSALPIISEGRYAPISLDTAVALQGPNVVAVPWLLDQLAPTLDKIAS